MREIIDYKSEVVVLDSTGETSDDGLKAEAKKITRIIDLRLMPLICIFYFMDYLDRANMGNASLAGIQDDLKLTPIQFSLAISGFYITYILFEVPSNIILKRAGAVRWLSFIIFVWGITTLAMSFTRDFAGLFTCRLFLGASESGFIPGILYLLSKFYKPNEITWRTAVFLCMASVSGIVSGPIAYATSFLDGHEGLKSWQYLFMIEGAPTICISAISYYCLFDDISQVSWLTQKQKDIHQAQVETDQTHSKASIRTIVRACLDWKTFMFASTYCLSAITSTSYQVFAPIIIDGFGFPVLTSQLLTAPPHAIQVFVILFGGYLTDKLKNKRGKMMAVGFFTTTLGYILLQVIESRWGKYGALFIIPIGNGIQNSANLSWSAINYPVLEVRAVAVAVVIMLGNTGGIIASYLYSSDDKPYYVFSNSFNTGVSLLGGIMSLLTSYFLYRQNCKLDLEEAKFGKEKRTEFRYNY